MAKPPKQSLATFPLIVTWVVLTVVVMKVHGDFNQTKELYRQLFSDIDNRIHPSLNTSVPKDVFVQLNLLSLREIVEREQYFVINAWMEITWKDEIRSWDPRQYDGVRVVYPGPTDMWKPRLIVSNSVDKRDLFEDDYAPFSLFWDGSAYWLPGTVFALSCTMDMTYFPLDRQSCSLRILAQQFALDINLIPALPTANTAGYSQNGEWHLDSTSVTPRLVKYKNLQLTSLMVSFNFRRRAAFYLFNVLMPVVLMSLLSPLVFVLPGDSGERVSYAVTLLLSLAVFMGFVASLLPQTSEPLSLCIVYMFVLLIHSGLCVVCSVVHLRWEKYKREQSHASYYCENQKQKQDTPQNDQSQQNATRISRVNLDSNTSTIGAEFFDADKDEPSNLDILTQNGFAHHENVAIDHQLKEVKKKSDGLANHATYRRPLPRSCESIWSANVILLVFFYVSWFAVSMYFLIRLL